MTIQIRFRGLPKSDSLHEYALRRLHAHLDRFAEELSVVVVRVDDVNGPRGGVDKRCQVTVRGRRFGSAAVDERGASAYLAVDAAAERMARTVGRTLERLRKIMRTTGHSLRSAT